MDNKNGVAFDLTELYKFESRYFQCSLLHNNILFVNDYRYHRDNNNLSKSKYKRYMIFRFGRSQRDSPLFAVCDENNRFPKQQPWHCKFILTTKELLQFLCQSPNLSSQSICQCESIAHTALPMHKNLQSNYFAESTLNSHSHPQSHSHGCHLHVIEKELLLMKSRVPVIDKKYNPTFRYRANTQLIICKLYEGFRRYDANARNLKNNNSKKRIHNHGNYGIHRTRGDHHNHNHNGGVNSNLMSKSKILNKFDYLEYLRLTLCVDRQLLLNKLNIAIKNAFLFVRKYPSTALTQAYIDANQCKISYELVILAELRYKKKYFKFGVPLGVTDIICSNYNYKYCDYKNINGNNVNNINNNVNIGINNIRMHTLNNNNNNDNNNDNNNNNNSKCYFAQNILSPYMVMNNVRLNSTNGILPENSWISEKYVNNDNLSFYNQYDLSFHHYNNFN